MTRIAFLTGILSLAFAAPARGVEPPPPHVALKLDVGVAGLGALTPGVALDYTTTVTGTVTSTALRTTLTVTDPGSVVPGHLVNGSIPLPQPLEVRADGSTFSPLPAEVRVYDAPLDKTPVTIDFKQPVAATDLLHAGDYGTTLTFTLATPGP